MSWKNYTLRIAGAGLLLAGVAKLVSSAGSAEILREYDPIFGIPNRSMMSALGMFECMIGVYCQRGNEIRRQAGVVLWLGSVFLVYRIGLWWIGYQKPCTCLGSIAEKVGLSDRGADMIMRVFLAYLICVGTAVLFLPHRFSMSRQRAA